MLFAAYFLALALIVLWPTPVDRGIGGIIDASLGHLHAIGAFRLVDYTVVEWVANVLLFIPFGVFTAIWLGPGRLWWATSAGMFASAAIETAQALLRPERVATVHDVVANTLGAAVGAGLAWLWDRRRPTNCSKDQPE